MPSAQFPIICTRIACTEHEYIDKKQKACFLFLKKQKTCLEQFIELARCTVLHCYAILNSNKKSAWMLPKVFLLNRANNCLNGFSKKFLLCTNIYRFRINACGHSFFAFSRSSFLRTLMSKLQNKNFKNILLV